MLMPFGIPNSSSISRSLVKFDPVPFVIAFADYLLACVPDGSMKRIMFSSTKSLPSSLATAHKMKLIDTILDVFKQEIKEANM